MHTNWYGMHFSGILGWEATAASFQLLPHLNTAGFQMGHLNL